MEISTSTSIPISKNPPLETTQSSGVRRLRRRFHLSPEKKALFAEWEKNLTVESVRVFITTPRQLSCIAFTKNKNIHIGPRAESHLAHESAHVVQQAFSRVKQPLTKILKSCKKALLDHGFSYKPMPS